MEEAFRALVLGVVQGATEFLPISSSAHLVLVPWLLGWEQPTLAFDVALHLGTLAAVLAYFRRDWVRLALALLASLRERRLAGQPDRAVAWLVIVGTVPAALAGFFGEPYVERLTERPAVVGALLLVTAAILFATRYARGERRTEHLTLADALAIGLAQALAILPGISRSGSTISMGLFRGLAPPEAARFSFLLAVPIIAGAGLGQAPDLAAGETGDMGAVAIAVGVLAAGITGLLAIHYLLKLLASSTLKPFALYCLAAGLLTLALSAVR
ncbi:MAG TPA: undecaprenyl-diphosphatase UppP [Dehalococcoidia bacterium]